MKKKSIQWARRSYAVSNPGQEPVTITVNGRCRWALEVLIVAGPKGCTPIDTPGPRWSGYVHNLRNQGVDIETRHEQHKGPFPGTHARYVLRANVKPLDSGEIAA